jgi:AcrR family transcriptional regulator
VGVSPAPEADAIDGRTARRDRNRELVLDAVLELFVERQLLPRAQEAAERSGVSLRSVFRYYEDTDALVQAAIARHLERIAPLFEIEGVGEGTFEERVDRFVDARLRLYDAVAPTARAALVRAPVNPVIGCRFAEARVEGRERLEAMFTAELAALPDARRRTVVAALDTMLQFESVEHLSEHLALTRGEVAAVLRETLAALLPH